jgi:hypothetical protein
MKPRIFEISWWPRPARTGGESPGPVKYKEFTDESEAMRFLDSLPQVRYWTKVTELKESRAHLPRVRPS